MSETTGNYEAFGPSSWETFGHLVDELIERADEIEGVRIAAGLVGTHEVWLHPTGKVQDWLRDFANEYRLWHRLIPAKGENAAPDDGPADSR